MNTRHAQPGAPFRQERWASSIRESRGLLGNLVADRLRDEVDEVRSLVWWLQARSWSPGGLQSVAHAVALGRDADVRHWLYRREGALRIADAAFARIAGCDGSDEPEAEEIRPQDMEEALAEFCLSKAAEIPDALIRALTALRSQQAFNAASAIARTAVVEAMGAALSKCSKIGSTILLEGPARIGKSAAARAWCDASGGLARYIATPHGNDLDPLFRSIAGAIGTAAGLSFKARQVEERILRALPGSGLTLVFDDAWNLWPQGDIRQSHPRRLQWLLPVLDSGVSVALVTAPQWWDCRRAFIAQTGWAVDQLDGRIAAVLSLPGRLTAEDCRGVAKALLPDSPHSVWNTLADIAVGSSRRLGALEAAVREAKCRAMEDGRPIPQEDDLKEAARTALRTEERFAAETARAPKSSRIPRSGSTVTTPGQTPARAARTTVDVGGRSIATSGSRSPGPDALKRPALEATGGSRPGRNSVRVDDEDFALAGNGSGVLALPGGEEPGLE